MTRNSSDIEVRALRIFEHSLPDECIENEESQDKQHLDYTLHLRDGGGRPSGIQFSAQVKGVSRARGARRISKSFKREHLKYWIEKARLPVFLVLSDIVEGEAYYIHAREWARTYGTKWKEQATTTVHIPRANRVGDHHRLIQAVCDADLEVQTSAGQHAIRALTERDGRFAYDVRNTSQGDPVVIVRAQEPVEVQVRALGQDAASRFHEMLRTGQRQDFAPGELSFDGGPLFEHLQRSAEGGPVGFQVVEERDCHLTILVEDEHGNRTPAIQGLRGRTEGGMERVEFDTALRDAPLRVRGYFERAGAPQGFRGELKVDLNLKAWVGHRFPALPGLESFSVFAEALRSANHAFLQFVVDGIQVEPPTILDEEIPALLAEKLTDALAFYRELAAVARKLGVSPKLPDLTSLSDDALEPVLALLELSRSGEISTPIREVETDLEFRLLDGVELPPREELFGGRFITTDRNDAELFGQKSPSHLLVRQVGPFALVPGQELTQDGALLRARAKSVQGAKVVYRLQTPEEAATPAVPDPEAAF